MADTKKPRDLPARDLPAGPRSVPKRPGADPNHKPARDICEDPALNPEAGGNLPETKTRAEVEKTRPDVKR